MINISPYQVNNVLRTYNKSLLLNKITEAEKEINPQATNFNVVDKISISEKALSQNSNEIKRK